MLIGKTIAQATIAGMFANGNACLLSAEGQAAARWGTQESMSVVGSGADTTPSSVATGIPLLTVMTADAHLLTPMDLI